MSLKKKLFSLAYVKKQFVFDKFCVGDSDDRQTLAAQNSKNCRCVDGVLTTGAGMIDYLTRTAYTVPTSEMKEKIKQIQPVPLKMAGYTFDERVLLLTENNKLYLYESEATSLTSLGQVGVKTKIALAMDLYNQVYAMVCGAAGVWSYGYTGQLNMVTENASCGICLWYADRLFFVDEPYALSYTAAGEPTVAEPQAAECGKIEIATAFGRIVGLGYVKDFMYIFLARGILRIRVKDGVENFALEEVPYGGGEIFYDGVISGGGRILFLARDGLYLFDGLKIEKVCRNMGVFPRAENQASGGVYADGYFYMQYTDTKGEKKRICVASDGKSGYFSFAVEGLSDGLGKGLFVYDKDIKEIAANGDLPAFEEYGFVSKPLDFDGEERKTLKTLRLYGAGSCTVTVATEGWEKKYSVDFENGKAVLPIGKLGKRFMLSFKLQKGGKISRVKADVVFLKNTKGRGQVWK